MLDRTDDGSTSNNERDDRNEGEEPTNSAAASPLNRDKQDDRNEPTNAAAGRALIRDERKEQDIWPPETHSPATSVRSTTKSNSATARTLTSNEQDENDEITNSAAARPLTRDKRNARRARRSYRFGRRLDTHPRRARQQ